MQPKASGDSRDCQCEDACVFQPLLVFVMVQRISIAVGPLGPQHLGEPLALAVGVVPEVEEEQQKDHTVGADYVHEDGELVGTVLQEEILTNVAGDHNELDL